MAAALETGGSRVLRAPGRSAPQLRRRGGSRPATLYSASHPRHRAFLIGIASALRPPHTPTHTPPPTQPLAGPRPGDPAQAAQIWGRRRPRFAGDLGGAPPRGAGARPAARSLSAGRRWFCKEIKETTEPSPQATGSPGNAPVAGR